ncbi:MAG: TonB-dependent receptor plug domain-containing protein [Ignavibacteria bacterium]
MKKIYLFTILLLFAVIQVSMSQTVTVLDKETLKPIKGAAISVNDKDFIYTNVLGQADVSQFKGNETIKFQASGFQALVYTYSRLETDKFSVSLGSKSYSTDEIVVSADRFNELLKDVPRQIDVLNTKDIQYSNVQNTAQLLEKTGNVSVQTSQQGGGSVVLRGFEASRVLIVVDGVRLNNAIFRAGHLQNILRIDNNMLDKVEVLYGPGSLMYGSDALGGVMNFYTKNPTLSLNNKLLTKGDAFVRYSTANQEKTGHMNISLGGKSVGFIGSFTFSDFGDLRMGANYEPTANDAWQRKYYVERVNGVDVMTKNDNVNIQKQSAYQQYDALGKFLIKQSDKVQHTFAFQYSNTNDVPRYDRLNIYSGSNLKFAQWYYGPESRLMGSYKLDLKNENSFYDNAQLTLAYQSIKESRNNRRFGNANLFSQNEKVDVMTGNLDFYKKLKENEIRYGIEGTYNIVKSTATKNNIVTGVSTPDVTRYPDGDNNMLSLAAYFSHSWEMNKQFTLSDGLRFSYVSLKSTFVDTTFYKFPFNEAKQNNSALNFSLGLVYMPTTDWRFYVNGASGFRAPNFDDLSKVFETATGNVIVPNNNLKPEYTYTGELGISKIFDNRIKLDGVAYYTMFSNAIITAPFQFNGQDSVTYQGVRSKVYANQNADKGAYVLGYNLNMSADLTNYLSLTSSLNFTYGRIKTDSVDVPLDHIPPVLGKTSLVLKLDKFKGDFTVMYSGWKRIWNFSDSGEDNLQDATPSGMPSWYTLNLGGAYQLTPNLQIQARLDNLLDKNYRTFASGFNAPGRNFVLSLRGNL